MFYISGNVKQTYVKNFDRKMLVEKKKVWNKLKQNFEDVFNVGEEINTRNIKKTLVK